MNHERRLFHLAFVTACNWGAVRGAPTPRPTELSINYVDLPPAPQAMYFHCTASVGNTLYVAGPFQEPGLLQSLDVASGAWSTLPPMPTKRWGVGCDACGGKGDEHWGTSEE